MATNLEDSVLTSDELESAELTASAEAQTASDEVTTEEFKISGDALVSRIKTLIQQGNIRRIIIQNEEGHTLIEIPLTIGVIGGTIGAALFPVVAAVGVIGAMVAHLTVVIERQNPD
ncbi:DUF4342 domain-containing protein [Synechococcus sp. PCC 7335]|uniref:DUF4342 domain-containing protein n=1 Tax=Synechococcus sp. (strain ATCC 29403 / PCC 7335) TaxID=91464 RepID=UPI0012FA43F7|nr:DUF4342 domain-containing protein [Synechococcus sp. PCC 7335]